MCGRDRCTPAHDIYELGQGEGRVQQLEASLSLDVWQGQLYYTPHDSYELGQGGGQNTAAFLSLYGCQGQLYSSPGQL
jgi:hypothetical protein